MSFPWERRLGATPQSDTTEVRVWAPRARRVALRAADGEHPLRDEGFGVHATTLTLPHGERYEIVLDGRRWPDPASRWQPEGLRGASAVLDPRAFAWTDAGWRGVPPAELVVYELHVGTFTPAGTFDAVTEHLPGLRELGVTAIELMPVAEFPGAHGWGYDGVYLSAAQSSYGGPEALARLVDAAHAHGLAVLLDVVYNHVGASGVKALEAFGPYFTKTYATPWGKAMNYDDADCDPVREWVLQSAEGWIRDFHFDGLRLDALHAIHDASALPIVRAIADRVHAAGGLVIAESGLNDPKVCERSGWGCDATWADDFHHALRTLVTDDRDGYYADFGAVEQLAKAFRRPHVHDGGYSGYRRRRYGAPADHLEPERFVVFCQNHDQVGNRAFGDRLPVAARPLAALLTLLSPFIPMLFMGEEYGETAPFQFFADHIDAKIAAATREGRRREFAAFAAFAGQEIPDPIDPATFAASKLTRTGDPPGLQALYARLLNVRREVLPRGDAEAIDVDRGVPWLRIARGATRLVAAFHRDGTVRVPAAGTIVVATHDDVVRDGDALVLGPLRGALVT